MRIFLVLLVFLSGCSWNIKDRQLFATYTALNMVDMAQTYRVLRDEDYYEINPLITKDNQIPIMIGTNLLLYFLADKFVDFRTKFLLFGCMVKTGLIINNVKVGL